MPRSPWTPRRSGHFVVCGGDSLTLHLVEELRRLDEDVVAVLPSRKDDMARQLRDLGASVVESTRPDGTAFRQARLSTARAVALVHQDDVGNIHAALTAQELNPDLRIVVRMFNTGLGERVRLLFDDCAVLSDAAISAPWFVAAALDEPVASVGVAERTMLIGHPTQINAETTFALADTTRPGDPRLLPEESESADLVLALADHSRVRPTGRRSGLWMWLVALRELVARRLRIALWLLLALLAAGTVLYGVVAYSWLDAAYVTILTAAGSADIELDATWHMRALQIVIVLVGVTIVPVFTAAVVDTVVSARIAYAFGGTLGALEGHFIVCGLGDVGSKVIEELHARGVAVVGVDRNESSSGVQLARQLRVPVIVGDVSREETMTAARVHAARCVIAVTDSDVANLEAGLSSRSLRPDLRVVLRIFSGELASMVERKFDIAISRSVSVLAAPTFAAAMLERRVITTIPVGRQVLVIADIPVAATAALDGATVGTADRSGQCRVLAVVRGNGQTYWQPHQNLVVIPGDRLIVLATRAGLSHALLSRAPTDPLSPGSDSPSGG